MSPLFSAYYVEFTTDTGLDWKTNIDTFIQYCQARALFVMMQQQQTLLTQLNTTIAALNI